MKMLCFLPLTHRAGPNVRHSNLLSPGVKNEVQSRCSVFLNTFMAHAMKVFYSCFPSSFSTLFYSCFFGSCGFISSLPQLAWD
jgi:hypothetical protein